jgi:hypothetical protein
MKVNYPITLDVKKTNVQKIIHANQGEGYDRELCFTLVSGNEKLNITSENEVYIKGMKEDQTIFFNPCIVKNNKAYYYLTPQNLAVVGDVDCQLGFISDGLTFTAKFTIDVQQGIISDSTIQSTDEFSELVQLIQTAGKGKIYYGTEIDEDPDTYPLIKEDDVFLLFDTDVLSIYVADSVSTVITWSKEFEVYSKNKVLDLIADFVTADDLAEALASYYTKIEVNAELAKKAFRFSGAGAPGYLVTEYPGVRLGDFYVDTTNKRLYYAEIVDTYNVSWKRVYNYTEAATALALKADKSTTYTKDEVDTALALKQDVISAGDGASFSNNTVSVKLSTMDNLISFDNTGGLLLGLHNLAYNTDFREELSNDSISNPLTLKSEAPIIYEGRVLPNKIEVKGDYANIKKGDIYKQLINSESYAYMYIVDDIWEESNKTYFKATRIIDNVIFSDDDPPEYTTDLLVEPGTIWVVYDENYTIEYGVYVNCGTDSIATTRYNWVQLINKYYVDVQLSYKQPLIDSSHKLSADLISTGSNSQVVPISTSTESGKYLKVKSDGTLEWASGGGGGTSYTAGNGIDITNSTISAKIVSSGNILGLNASGLYVYGSDIVNDISFKAAMPYDSDIRQALTSGNNYPLQPKLTAGTNITITDNVISASGGGLSYTFTDGLTESSGTVGIDLASGSKLLIDANDKLDVDLSSKQDTIDSSHKLSADYIELLSNGCLVSVNGELAINAQPLGFDIDLRQALANTNANHPLATKASVDGKQDNTTITTDTSATTVSLTLADNNEYRYTQELSSLTLTMPSGDFISSIVFASGSTPTSMTYDSSIKWSGTDVTSNAFVPQANQEYEIVFWYNGLSVNAVVRGVA